MYLATLWWLPYVEIFFHGGLCSMHKSAILEEITKWKILILLRVAEKKQR
jgi:hypothetical protein